MLEFFSILGSARFLLCMNDPRNYVICNNAVYAYDTTLYCKFEQASDWWQQLDLLLEEKLFFIFYSPLNWIGVLTLSLLLKLPARKLGP